LSMYALHGIYEFFASSFHNLSHGLVCWRIFLLTLVFHANCTRIVNLFFVATCLLTKCGVACYLGFVEGHCFLGRQCSLSHSLGC
jgi:hypothetical protein